jgi:osmotically-inducible protein OsmY
MKTTRLSGAVVLALVLAGPLALPGCAKAGPKAVAGSMDDATISTRVKTVFLNDPVIGLARIDVETFGGVVTLSGRVKSKEEEVKAIELARPVKGVTDVKSKLQIQP